MSNRLKNESSPYLLQHADNPVDWYPWGEEAFQKAEREDKPVFLSIGYSTCHWCHVMAHESFEDDKIAKMLNTHFVCIKVDREERPDIDSVYMSVCQMLTGSGGWPMSIFMTAGQTPFFAGTYFPPASHYGMMGFYDLLAAIVDKWKNDKERLLESANHILAHINSDTKKTEVFENIDIGLLNKAAKIFSQSFDARYGGFGAAPKFPTPHNLIFLALYAKIKKEKTVFEQVRLTLEKMRRGGIFDHIGYGFSRYSTDKYYLVPHFEKMLYDNALLMMAYCVGYKASGEKVFLDTAVKTAEYILREMTSPDGGFYSAQDADSEGKEGKFYVFGYEEVLKVLGRERGEQFCKHFGITPAGNFERKNIPNLLNGNEIADDFDKEKRQLYDYRKSRMQLHLDDKILTSWNALMICAMTMLFKATGKRDYLLAAENAYQFIEEKLTDGNILYVSCRGKRRSVKGFLEEYAYYTAALISLYEVTAKPAYLERAEQICGEAGRQFADEECGGCFLYGMENTSLITRPKETYDGALPSGNSVMAYCLVRLSQIDGTKSGYMEEAKKQLAFMSGEAQGYPAGYSMFLIALLFYMYPQQKITAVMAEGDDKDEIMSALPLYADIRILTQEEEEYKLLNNKTTYYVCKDHTCLPPVNEIPTDLQANRV